MKTTKRKEQSNFRLTPTARELLSSLADRKGVSQTARLEILIRDEAKREKIEIKA